MTHHDVFISYSTHDKPISDAVCAALEGHGIRCWVAPRDITPGQDWSDAIIDAIADCHVCLLILSTASNQSDQVKREVQNAVSEAKPILPFRIEDVALSKHMRYFIGTPHWLDAMTPPMERHLKKMVETVAGLISALNDKAGEAAPPPVLPRACFLWDDAHLARIEAELRQFVGPLGRTLVAEAAVIASGYDDLCRRLAGHILSEREQQTFLARCHAPTPAAEPPAPGPVPSAEVISAETIAVAEKALAHYVGPLARTLAKRAARTAVSRAEFYHLLAEELATPAEKAAFLAQCQGGKGGGAAGRTNKTPGL